MTDRIFEAGAGTTAHDGHARSKLMGGDEAARALAERGVRLAQQGLLGVAIECLRQAAMLAPLVPDLHLNLGVALMHAGRLTEAEAAMQRAQSLTPRRPAVAKNLGMLLLAGGKSVEAVKTFKQALKLERGGRDTAPILNNLGVALRRLDRLDEALQSFRRAVQADPGLIDAAKNLALTLTDLLRTDEALAVLDRALARSPNAAELHAQRAHALKERGQVDEAMAAMAEARRLAPGNREMLTSQLLLAQYQDGVTAERLAALHRDAERLIGAPLRAEPRPHATERTSDRPLRVGYVSGDLRRHPVGFFMAAVIPHHDRARVVPVVYSCHPHEDAVTARIRAGAAEWYQVHNASDAALAELIRSHRIDILIDLAGHTAHNRLGVFARRPAPVHATWAGYVGTTGLSAIDWLIADRFHVPEGEEAHYAERVVRLPHGYVCWMPPEAAPEIGPLPALANGHVTFGSFNNIAKVTPSVVAAWAEVLQRVPDARLVLRTRALGDAGVRARYLALFAARGIAGERLTLAGELPHDKLLAAYGEVDVALDTFPYAGGVTTLEALWMGVPVMTIAGATFAGRHAASHLANAGYPELVTADVAGYVDTAAALAADLPDLVALRARLRADVAASPLLDHAGFVRQLEQAMQRLRAEAHF